MKTAIAAIICVSIGTICVSIGIGISYAFIENNKPVKREPIQAFIENNKPVKYELIKKLEIEWWHQFLGPHTVKEIVYAAYEASRVYERVNCEKWTSGAATDYGNMTPLQKDFYYRIFMLGDTETEKCIISKDPSKYLL